MGNTVVKIYKNEKECERGVSDMSRGGYSVVSINGVEGRYKVGKGVVLAGVGALLLGPLGLLAGGLAGRKSQNFTVLFVK